MLVPAAGNHCSDGAKRSSKTELVVAQTLLNLVEIPLKVQKQLEGPVTGLAVQANLN